MPKNFNSIEEKREYERTRKQIQKQTGTNKEKREYIVYSVHLKENWECVYVGMTSNLNERIRSHKSTSKRENSAFYNYVKEKGGWDNFHFNNAINKEATTKGDILIYENYFIRYLNPICNGVRPYISNADYNRIADELGHPKIPDPVMRNLQYKKASTPKFEGLNPILDDQETRTYTIYKIECKGKIYVGQTFDTIKRFADHKENSKTYDINILYNHIYDSGGWEESKTEITTLWSGKVSKRQILKIEAYFIKKLKPELNSLFPYISAEDEAEIYHKYSQLQ